MQQRQIGKTGQKISAIGIGAMSFTNFYGETSENQSHDILKTALDYGVSHIDTANVYGGGLAEQVIGNFLKKYTLKDSNVEKNYLQMLLHLVHLNQRLVQ